MTFFQMLTKTDTVFVLYIISYTFRNHYNARRLSKSDTYFITLSATVMSGIHEIPCIAN
jgi:hypothetical protein